MPGRPVEVDLTHPFPPSAVFVTSPQRAELVLMAEAGPRGGSCYEYRGVAVQSNASATRHWFFLTGFPGCQGEAWQEAVHLPLITAAVDAWLDAGKVPSHPSDASLPLFAPTPGRRDGGRRGVPMAEVQPPPSYVNKEAVDVT